MTLILLSFSALLLALWGASSGLLFFHLRAKLRRAEALQAEQAQQLRSLEARAMPIPGVDRVEPGGEKSWTVTVGGQSVEIEPLSPKAWAETMQELPGFLFAYAQAKAENRDMSESDLEHLVERAKSWLAGCAVGEVRLEKLTVPEAMDALVRISRLNGVSDNLAAFFRERGLVA